MQAAVARPALRDRTQTLGGPQRNSDRKGRLLPKSRAQTTPLELVTSQARPVCSTGEEPPPPCPPARRPSHLHMEVRLAVEEVKEPLVVEELGIPLLGLVVSEVIPQWHQEDVASEQPGLFPVLVQEQRGPTVRKGTGPSGVWA